MKLFISKHTHRSAPMLSVSLLHRHSATSWLKVLPPQNTEYKFCHFHLLTFWLQSNSSPALLFNLWWGAMYLEGACVFTAGLLLGVMASQRYNLPRFRTMRQTIERLKEVERKYRRNLPPDKQ
ncbi:hypothetical protein Btru_077831 [Bulinus truncatus]|nr:hypothetical protein Btru_077831 [Bulinus truncatus]